MLEIFDTATYDADLFDRPKAIRCFGGEAQLGQLLNQFLHQLDSRLVSLRVALEAGDLKGVRTAMHWLRGGMSYLFSPATERVCLKLDKEIAQDPLPDVRETLAALESALHRYQQHARESVSVRCGGDPRSAA